MAPFGQTEVNSVPDLFLRFRFDGRTIRVDKASDTGPRGGFGGGRGGSMPFGGRGGYPMQMPYAAGSPAQGYPMAAPNMYAPMPYGRGYPPQGQPGYAAPPQGELAPARMTDMGEG